MPKFEPRTLTINLYQGDWQQRVDLARTKAAAAEQRWNDLKNRSQQRARLLHEDPPDIEARDEFYRLAAKHDEIKAKAEAEGGIAIVLKARSRKRWDDIVEANPPRTGEDVPEDIRKTDLELGINDKTTGEMLVPESIVSIDDDVYPEPAETNSWTPAPEVREFVDAISSAQFDLLYGAAFALNRGTGSDPKAARSLMPSQSSSETEN